MKNSKNEAEYARKQSTLQTKKLNKTRFKIFRVTHLYSQ
jgi:hypothetical protein